MPNFTEVFEDVTKLGKKVPTNLYLESGLYPVIDQGQSYIAGYINDSDGIFSDVPAIIFGDHTRAIKYVNQPFFLGADGVKVLKAKVDNVDYKYLYYSLCCAKIPDTGYNRHFKWLKEVEIPLPPLAIQKEIAYNLDKVSEAIDLCRKILEKLDFLVKAKFAEMFGDINLSKELDSWTPISQIGTVVGGATPKTNVPEYWDGEYRWITPAELDNDAGYIYDSARKLTKAGVESCSLQELPIGTVILSSRAPIGKVAIAGATFYCNQGFKNIICGDSVNPIYLYTLLKYNTDYLNSLGRGATF